MALIFFTVSGGAYGLEPVVAATGGTLALLLIFLVPLLFSLPIALAAGELSALFPVSGGYYRWVQIGLGEFWGFQEGWWSWLYTFVDMALYPTLCGDILVQLWPALTGHGLSAWGRAGFILGFIWVAALINWCGPHFVSNYAILVMTAVLAPFAVFVGRAFLHAPATVVTGHPVLSARTLGVALAALLWNYSGWDNVGTFAPAVNRPARTYPRALLGALLLIFVAYALPVLAGLRLDPKVADWQDGYFVQLGGAAGGVALQLAMALTAVASGWAQYTSQLLYVIPLPVAMAADGYLPRSLSATDRRGTPVRALLLSSVLYSVFAMASFGHLLVADTLLYAAGLGLEFWALIRLRRTQAEVARPFRMPFQGKSLVAVCLLPLAVAGVAVSLAARTATWFVALALVMLLSGPLVYFARRKPRLIGEQ